MKFISVIRPLRVGSVIEFRVEAAIVMEDGGDPNLIVNASGYVADWK